MVKHDMLKVKSECVKDLLNERKINLAEYLEKGIDK